MCAGPRRPPSGGAVSVFWGRRTRRSADRRTRHEGTDSQPSRGSGPGQSVAGDRPLPPAGDSDGGLPVRRPGGDLARFLASTGIATTTYWGPEAEFFVFDDVRYEQTQHSAFYAIDSAEGAWNSGRDEKPNLGYKPRHKEGYFPAPPADSLQDFRSELVLKMKEAGMEVEVHHHEVASAGQCEIDLRFTTLTDMGDRLMLYKYLTKMFARQHFKTVTFMPKPIFGDNGSGMHCHQSLWKDGVNLFFDPQGYAQVSEMAMHYIGGLPAQCPALMAFCAPTTNSYRRLVPGYEAPVNLVYSQRNRSAAVRIPVYSSSPRSKRIEYRPPDPSANPYLAFAALLMAGLDGVRRQLEPRQPDGVGVYEPAG